MAQRCSACRGLLLPPPFYREMRGLDGRVRDDVAPQRAIHAVAGVDHEFSSKGRPSSLWGSSLERPRQPHPYEIENVRQRYYATNNASGYATGVDMMLNGEFIPGSKVGCACPRSKRKKTSSTTATRSTSMPTDSGRARLPQRPVCHHHRHRGGAPGMIPRPADQRFSFSLLFKTRCRATRTTRCCSASSMAAVPYGPPSFNRPKTSLRTPAYRRVDVGFSGPCSATKPSGRACVHRSLQPVWASTTPSTTTGSRTSMDATTPCPTS